MRIDVVASADHPFYHVTAGADEAVALSLADVVIEDEEEAEE